MILTTLLAAATLSSGPTVSPNVVPVAPGTSEQTAEGVEILRRLVTEELDKAFETPGKDEMPPGVYSLSQNVQVNGLVTRLWAGDRTVDHSRAFHLPDVGLFLTLDMSLPVVASKAANEPAKDPKATDDEWERIRIQVRGGVPTNGPFRRQLLLSPHQQGEVDPQAIERVIDLVLRTVARHASRVEGVGANETVTIALLLEGKSHTLWQDFAKADHEDGDGSTTLLDPEDPAVAGFGKGFSTFVLAGQQDVREQHLVIRVTLSDLAAAGDSVERMRSRALINRY